MPLGANMPMPQTSLRSISYFCWYLCKHGVLQRVCKVRDTMTIHVRGQSQSWRPLQLISRDILQASKQFRACACIWPFLFVPFLFHMQSRHTVTVIFCLSCKDCRSPVRTYISWTIFGQAIGDSQQVSCSTNLWRKLQYFVMQYKLRKLQ